MSIDERLEAITRNQEIDGQHIRQLAGFIQDLHASVTKTDRSLERLEAESEKTQIALQKMSNAMESLAETLAIHETRISRIEQGQ